MKAFIALTALVFCLLAAPAESGPRRDVLAGPIEGVVTQVQDGDTFTMRLRVWIGQDVETLVRLNGIDTPEIKGKCDSERTLAQQARDEIARLVGDSKIRLYNVRLEKYAGRVLADAETADGVKISEHMIEKGFARPYHGKKRGSWCD